VNRQNSSFTEDDVIDERFRSSLSDFRGSGYDRGHMAPAMNHQSSSRDMDETFYLTNISPQVGIGFNRDYWARFERFCKTLVTLHGYDDVFVLTGPLYLPSKASRGGSSNTKWQMKHLCIGDAPRLVAVPTHFFKVILAEKGKTENSRRKGGGRKEGDDNVDLSMAAFVMPNEATDHATPLAAFSVPIRSLEEAGA